MTLSTTEAESCALLKAAKHIAYLRRLLQELNLCGDMLICLVIDLQSIIKLDHNLILHVKT